MTLDRLQRLEAAAEPTARRLPTGPPPEAPLREIRAEVSQRLGRPVGRTWTGEHVPMFVREP
jgi:hypothetical protein